MSKAFDHCFQLAVLGLVQIHGRSPPQALALRLNKNLSPFLTPSKKP